MLVKGSLVSIFLIALLPHTFFGLQYISLDDFPVLIAWLFIGIILFNKGLRNLANELKKNKYLMIWLVYLLYILINPLLTSDIFQVTTDFLRYSFLFSILLVFTFEKEYSLHIHRISRFFFIFFSSFSIVAYLFQIQLGTDSYNYWNIGFNQNMWGFTEGRVNGFQAGGPNAFGDLICILGLKNLSQKNLSRIELNLTIAFCYFGCFFTYSRGSILVFVFLATVLLISRKKFVYTISLIFCILISLNFGLIDRFSSNQETDGIQDRVEMQTVSIQNIAERELENKVFGYGFNKVAVVRSKLMPIEEFSNDLRPTGPHNGYIYQVLNYGYVGVILFLVILGYPFYTKRKLINVINSEYMLPIFGFLILNFNGDAFQNQSISWLFWIYLFQISLISDEQ